MTRRGVDVKRVGNVVTIVRHLNEVQVDATFPELDARDALDLARELQRHAADIMARPVSNRGDGRITRGALLTAADRAAERRTACGLRCSGCGAELPTELDFAEHFSISRADVQAGLWNLGNCPADTRR